MFSEVGMFSWFEIEDAAISLSLEAALNVVSQLLAQLRENSMRNLALKQ